MACLSCEEAARARDKAKLEDAKRRAKIYAASKKEVVELVIFRTVNDGYGFCEPGDDVLTRRPTVEHISFRR